MTEPDEKIETMLEPLSEAEYEAAAVPSPEAIRSALSRGADVLRKAAEQPRSPRVDPKIRFR